MQSSCNNNPNEYYSVCRRKILIHQQVVKVLVKPVNKIPVVRFMIIKWSTLKNLLTITAIDKSLNNYPVCKSWNSSLSDAFTNNCMIRWAIIISFFFPVCCYCFRLKEDNWSKQYKPCLGFGSKQKPRILSEAVVTNNPCWGLSSCHIP